MLAVSRRFEKDGDFAKSGLRALGDCGRLSAVRPGSADDGSLLGFRAVELGDAPARAAGARCLLPRQTTSQYTFLTYPRSSSMPW